MEIGFVGLGRMGFNMVSRMLASGGIRVVVWNRSQDKVHEAESKGAVGSSSVEDMISKLAQGRKVLWLMLPSGDVTEEVFQNALSRLSPGDILIDGGNSNFHDSVRRASQASQKGIDFLDAGVSGGVVAAHRGYAMMVGGSKEAFEFCRPIFDSFGYPNGYGHVGPSGSGHYVKMIHNAIEYGMMQSIAEGYDLLKNGRFKDIDAGTVLQIWNNGCIISSFLMEMAADAIKKNPMLDYRPIVQDSGEGRWASMEAMEHNVPFVANTYALHARYISRDDSSLAFRLLAAIRNEFGGHELKR